MTWKSIKQTALIGTEKKPLDHSVLPEMIQQSLPNEGESAETQLLTAAAFTSFYQEAGALALDTPGISDQIHTNSLPEAGTEAMNLFSVITSLDQRIQPKLIRLWLDWMIRDKRVIQPAAAVKLVQLTESMGMEIRSKTGQILGEKGRWMLSFYPNKSFLPEKHVDHLWEEGTADQRRTFWMDLRKQNHAQAMKLLMASWETESIAFKKSILSRLMSDLHPEDLPYLEKWHNGEFAWQEKEKKMETECREIVATCLLSLPQSSLYQQVSQALKPFFIQQKKSALLGLISTTYTTIQLPPEKFPDSFWNAGHLNALLGFGDHYDIANFRSVNEYWLGLLLENLPASFWLSHFTKGLESMVDYLLGPDFQITRNKKIIAIYEPTLITHAIHHKNGELALLLLKKITQSRNYELYHVLLPQDFEKLVIEDGLWSDVNILENSPTDHWSIGFSKTMFQETLNLAETNPYQLTALLGSSIGYRLHDDMLPLLDRYLEKMKDHERFNAWKNNIYEPALTSLTLKKALKASIL